jgi:hypothetical protein
MQIPLGAFLQSSVGALAKRVLIALGFGMVSFGAITAALNKLIGIAQSAYTGLPAYAFAFLGLAGVGYGLGLVAGALTFRAAYIAMPKLMALSK